MPTPVLESAALSRLGFAHGFFLRSVEPDWDTACEHLGVPRSRLFLLSQVHGRDAELAKEDDDPRAFAKRSGDIVVARGAGLACGTRVADCVPVLLACPDTGAVAAVHSGWRGTVSGAVLAGVEALRTAGATSGVVAAVGPHIGPCCFEVGDDVAATIAACSPLGAAIVDRSRPKPHIDLRRVIAAQLESVGVTAIDHVHGCTRCEPERFHSFRRDGHASGRMLGAIVTRTATSPAFGG
jgi:YfiH family protein